MTNETNPTVVRTSETLTATCPDGTVYVDKMTPTRAKYVAATFSGPSQNGGYSVNYHKTLSAAGKPAWPGAKTVVIEVVDI